MFKVEDNKFEPNKIELKILEFWQKKQIFAKTQKLKKGQKYFVFYEGPPTANGQPGIHHVMARSFKDIFLRYKTMQGFFVLRKGGWDTHGLPVELQIEKELGLSGKKQIEEYGIAKFNEKCRQSVYRYIEDWEKLTTRIGFWLDTKNPYETLDPKYIESEWWILKQLWDKKLLVKDYKVVPYCYRCQTTLSSHEVAQGYEDVTEDSIYIKFELENEPETFFLAWTTTPWTLLGNVALAVNLKATYVKVKTAKGQLIMAKDRLSALNLDSSQIIAEYTGQNLVGKKYKPIFEYIKYDKPAFFVVSADFVELNEGTGIVHTAVMYGEEDFELGRKTNLPEHHCVMPDGKFSTECGPYAGLVAKTSQAKIMADLDKAGKLFKKETITHAYPFCWRCHTPLLYYALDSWFIKTTKVKKQLIKVNDDTYWYPDYIKNGRMGNWLKTLIDWNVSRSRYWGTPLPIWQCSKCHENICLGSFKEAEKYQGKIPEDPHRPFVDEVELVCPKCSGKMKRVPEVIDCWFDSGAMPFAQWHYPFENEKIFKDQFPADYVSEAMDQTRGWFYTLMAISTLINGKNCYKNVLCNGLVLDEKGQKMSKHIGNVVDPWKVIENNGVDSLRWYFFSAVKSGENYRFAEKNIRDINAKLFLVCWNVYKFFTLYANLDKWDNKKLPKFTSNNVLDQWINSRLYQLIKDVTKSLNEFDTFTATQKIANFVDELSNWYIRRSRDRVGPTALNQEDKNAFYQTVYSVLQNLAKIMAPFAPFFSESLFQNLNGQILREQSVHLTKWPKVRKEIIYYGLESEMAMARTICEIGHRARKDASLKVRQPLNKATIKAYKQIYTLKIIELMKDELNVKDIAWNETKDSEISVVLDTEIDQNLKKEGEFRELIRQVQDLRKQSGCNLNSKIRLHLPNKLSSEETQMLKQKTLAQEIVSDTTLKIDIL